MTLKGIEAMGCWTLEDFQKDAIWAVEKVRKLAMLCSMAVRDIDGVVQGGINACDICIGSIGGNRTCPAPEDDNTDCGACAHASECRCASCETQSNFVWWGLE